MVELHAECPPCILSVRLREILSSGVSEEKGIGTMFRLLRGFIELVERGERDVTVVATGLFRIMKEELGDDDPYRREKEAAIFFGLRLYERAKGILERVDARERLEYAVRASILGNTFDLGVSGYEAPEPESLLERIEGMEIRGGGHRAAFERPAGKLVAYLLDNAGEAALDRVLAEELRSAGAEVVGVVKSGSFQDDVTVREVDRLRLWESFDRIVESGTDASSVFLEEIGEEVEELLERADLVVAKGMAHFEYLSENEGKLGKPVLYLLRAKCRPVSAALRVGVGDYVSVLG